MQPLLGDAEVLLQRFIDGVYCLLQGGTARLYLCSVAGREYRDFPGSGLFQLLKQPGNGIFGEVELLPHIKGSCAVAHTHYGKGSSVAFRCRNGVLQ